MSAVDDPAGLSQDSASCASDAPSSDPSPAADSSPPPSQSLWSAWEVASQTLQSHTSGLIQGMTKALGTALGQAGQAVGEAIEGTTQTVSSALEETGKKVGETLETTQRFVGERVTDTGQAIGSTIEEGRKAASSALDGTTQAIGASLQQTHATLSTGINQAGAKAYQTVQEVAQNTGQSLTETWSAATEFTQSQVQALTENLDVKLLLPIIQAVDLQAATSVVQELREKYPQDSNEALAHRLIQKKVVLVGSLGFVSSLVPGAAAALLGFDLAALASAQAELGYQIAAVYGLDLEDSARQWEILAIFGAAMGTDLALKTGLKYALRNVPIAGGVVGASTNAMALYAVGYAACRFYESQGQALNSQAAAQEALNAGADYLEAAQEQQLLVDQIIAHMVKASFPDRSWAATLPELEPYHLSPASLATIEAHLANPTPLTDLLENLTDDYGLVALFTCQAIANTDHTITAAEDTILTTLSAKLG